MNSVFLPFKNKIKQFGILESIVLFFYIIVVLFISFHHEFSPDEAQSWLIARDLNIIDIIKQMQYEGHSFLWHFLLVPFAKLGLPVESQHLISCGFAISTVYLIFQKSNFSRITKVLLTFSVGLIYYYSAFARPYCMIPFLLAAIASVYTKRKEKPYLYCILIGLLANTHIIMLPTSFLLLLFYIIENRNNNKKFLLSYGIGIVFILIPIIIAFIAYHHCSIVNIINSIKDPFNHPWPYIQNQWNSMNEKYYGKIVSNFYSCIVMILMIVCFLTSFQHKKQGFIFWSQWLFSFLLHSFFWFDSSIRTYIILYTWMFFTWIEKETCFKKSIILEVLLIVWLIITIPGNYKQMGKDLTKQFSSGKDISVYIQNNLPKHSVMINCKSDFQQLIAAHFKKDEYLFYMVNSQNFATFNTWDKDYTKPISKGQIIHAIDLLKGNHDHLYLLYPSVIGRDKIDLFLIDDMYSFNPIYQTDITNIVKSQYRINIYDQVGFTLYEIKEKQ